MGRHSAAEEEGAECVSWDWEGAVVAESSEIWVRMRSGPIFKLAKTNQTVFQTSWAAALCGPNIPHLQGRLRLHVKAFCSGEAEPHFLMYTYLHCAGRWLT